MFSFSEQACDDKSIVFACFYCYSQPSYFINTFKELYAHWESSHDSLTKPFRFFAVAKAACYYCGKIDVFLNLLGHHRHRHHSEIMVIVNKDNKSKCGLCHRIFSSSEMVIHFKTHHEPSLLAGITNPICFTQSEIEQLLTINSTDSMKVSGQMKAFFCGHCSIAKNINDTTFIDHIEKDIFLFRCSVCSVITKSIDEIVRHEMFAHKSINVEMTHSNILSNRLERYYLRTKMVFSNGLVLFKHNLLNTSFDDRTDFWPFKEQFIRRKLQECTEKVPNEENLPTILKCELSRQRKYRKNLCIRRITVAIMPNDELFKIFKFLCTIIDIKISQDDIESIFQRPGHDIIIQLKKIELKKMILKKWEKTDESILSDKMRMLSKMWPAIDPTNLNLINDVTDFFRQLSLDAQEAKDKHKIHSYWVSDKGLSIKITPKSEIQIIWSKADLMKYIGIKKSF